MSPIGHPKFQYHIPYDGDADWYIILTSKNFHFYFNRRLRKSYWQLSDIFTENKNIKQDEFVACIDYDWVSLLVAKNNGLKDIEKRYVRRQASKKDLQPGDSTVAFGIQDNVDVNGADLKPGDESDDSHVSQEDMGSVMPENDGDSVHSVSLKAEGPAEDSKSPDSSSPEPAGTGLLAGYSSSDDSDEEVVEETPLGTEKSEPQHSPEEIQEDESDSLEGGLNQDLDLSLSGDDIEGGSSPVLEERSKEAEEFKTMLDRFKDKISVYDTWSLVKEELIEEFVQQPEYFTLTDESVCGTLFNEWCRERIKSHEADVEPDVHDAKYPTSTIKLFHFLQVYKKQIRVSFYNDFSRKHGDALASFDLSYKARENLYRVFKVAISEFADFEKRKKKAGQSEKGVNLKKNHLDEFLISKASMLDSAEYSQQQVQEFESHMTSSDFEDFEKWIRLLNTFEIPEEIAENPSNFIVGDEKRYMSYLDFLKSFYK